LVRRPESEPQGERPESKPRRRSRRAAPGLAVSSPPGSART